MSPCFNKASRICKSTLITLFPTQWPVHLPAKTPPCFYKIEVESLTVSVHILLGHIKGRLRWKGWQQGTTACWLSREPKVRAWLTLKGSFTQVKADFSSYILLILMLLTPEQCYSITMSTITAWALQIPCCSLKVFHQNYQRHPVVPVEVQNETLSYIHLQQEWQTPNREVIHWLKRSMFIPSNEALERLFSLFASENPWK